MASKRIGLYGIGGLYNYGCEAIIRGTVRLIREVNPEARIAYFSPRADEDAVKISDLGIEVVQMPSPRRGFFLKAAGKLSKLACVPFDSTGESYDTVLDGCDVLVSIGGDIYTIPAHLREKGRYPYFNRLIKLGELASERGVVEVIMGASIGPFGDFAPAVGYYVDHLRKCETIFCRERVTLDYLASIGIESNATFLPDPAFFVENPADLGAYEDARYIGVNLSPLSLRELHGGVAKEAVVELACQVQELMDITGLPALLIPHVLAPLDADNDERFMRMLFEELNEGHRARCEVVVPTDFIDAKRYLAQCRVVVAARMHCAVNAMCVGVPTVLLSYSKKSVGMCEVVYGDTRWVVPLGDADEVRRAVGALYTEREQAHAYLTGRIEELRGALADEAHLRALGRVFS